MFARLFLATFRQHSSNHILHVAAFVEPSIGICESTGKLTLAALMVPVMKAMQGMKGMKTGKRVKAMKSGKGAKAMKSGMGATAMKSGKGAKAMKILKAMKPKKAFVNLMNENNHTLPSMVHTVVKMSKRGKAEQFEAVLSSAYSDWDDMRGYNASFKCKPACSWWEFRKDALEQAGWLLINRKLASKPEGWLKIHSEPVMPLEC